MSTVTALQKAQGWNRRCVTWGSCSIRRGYLLSGFLARLSTDVGEERKGRCPGGEPLACWLQVKLEHTITVTSDLPTSISKYYCRGLFIISLHPFPTVFSRHPNFKLDSLEKGKGNSLNKKVAVIWYKFKFSFYVKSVSTDNWIQLWYVNTLGKVFTFYFTCKGWEPLASSVR